MGSIKIRYVIILFMLLFILTGCASKSTSKPKVEKMIKTIERADSAIDSYIEGEIDGKQLSNELETIGEYCEAYKQESIDFMKENNIYANESDTWISLLCISIKTKSVMAYNSYFDKYYSSKSCDLSCWKKEKEEVNEYRKYFE